MHTKLIGAALLVAASLTLTGCAVEGIADTGELTRGKAKKDLEQFYQGAVVADDRTYFECEGSDCLLLERGRITFGHYEGWQPDAVERDREEFRSRMVSEGYADGFTYTKLLKYHNVAPYAFTATDKFRNRMRGDGQIAFADVQGVEVTGITSMPYGFLGDGLVAECVITASVRPELAAIYGSGTWKLRVSHAFDKYDDGWRLNTERATATGASDEFPVAIAVFGKSGHLYSFNR